MAEPTAPVGGLALDHRRKPLGTVHVMLLPIGNGAEAPAHLRWGNWGACPAAEYHVAMLRSWRERYGAELVGAGGLDLNLRVARRPRTVEEAVALAREQMAYCENAIFNRITTVQALAASLMANDWWYFWWDSSGGRDWALRRARVRARRRRPSARGA